MGNKPSPAPLISTLNFNMPKFKWDVAEEPAINNF